MGELTLQRIELVEIDMPLKHSFETSFGVTTGRRVILVRAIDNNGNAGYGECTAMERPFYNPESVDPAWQVIIKTIAPMLASAGVRTAADVNEVLSPIKGNRMSIAAVETAIWDLEAKIRDVPLHKLLGGSRREISCGVSIGIQANTEVLLEKVAKEIDAGYQRIKIKIKPGKDIDLVEAVRKVYPDILLSVDANSAYELERDLDVMLALDEYGLLMIEQPLTAGDILDHAKLQQKLRTAICLDESISCLRDARQAIEIDACRIINIKLGRVGGHSQAREIQEFAHSKGVPVWCGGMLETGIGRAHNIAMSTLPGFVLPGDVSASARYWKEDIVEPPIEVSSRGTIEVPSGAGIGYTVRESEIERLASRRFSIEL
ncbi:MAG: o-succinylbenzoate synthase [Pyrinomonadaceae bacterium]|nr:o-succinylbenzoate synthase [Pyrinomonadaceae bacterium]